MLKFGVFLIFGVFFATLECSKILGVFPVPSISHQVVFRTLTLELVKRGHEMIVITPDPAFKDKERPTNLIELDMRNISYSIMREYMDSVSGTTNYEFLMPMLDAMVRIAEAQFNTPEVQNLLKSDQKFDLIIIESVMPTSLGFAYKFKAPVIEISSLYGTDFNYICMGAPTHPFLYPPVTRYDLRNLSLADKLYYVAVESYLAVRYMNVIENMDHLLKKIIGEDIPSVLELEKNVDMLFVNSFPFWDFNRPVALNVVFLGAFHVKEPKELPKDLKKLLDSSKHGFIYVSFGSNVDPTKFSLEKIRMFLNVFSKIPYDVIWKWNEGDLPGKPRNVHTFKWLPQNDLLYHPNIKLFVTQGGMQSTDEAITAGVPLLGIPILGDQFFNVAKYEHFKIGERLVLETLSEEELLKTINSMIENRSYKENILNLRNLMHDTPNTATERAVWWTEYVIRHKGAKHLKPPSAYVSYTEYFELELVAAIFGILIAVTSLIILVLYMIAKLFLRLLTKQETIKLKKK